MIDATLEFPDIMTDIETTGLKVGDNAIIQIAAVRFNLEKQTIDTSSFFDRCLMIPPTRYWDESCRENFWLKDKRELLQYILGRGEDPLTVLMAFRDWVGPKARFWGKPTHFDFAFLQNYYNSYGHPMPFHYRYANDMNTFIRARYWPEDPPNFELELEFQGTAHNALDDCIHQVSVLFAAAEATKQMIFVP